MPQELVCITEGQGVHREVKSEGLAEKYQAVTENMNRSAKDEEKSSLHYKGEGVTSPLIVPRCVRAAWYRR